jgi:hypothetical protein
LLPFQKSIGTIGVSKVGVIIVGNQLLLLLFRGIIDYSSSGLGMLFVTAELDYSRCSIISFILGHSCCLVVLGDNINE